MCVNTTIGLIDDNRWEAIHTLLLYNINRDIEIEIELF